MGPDAEQGLREFNLGDLVPLPIIQWSSYRHFTYPVQSIFRLDSVAFHSSAIVDSGEMTHLIFNYYQSITWSGDSPFEHDQIFLGVDLNDFDIPHRHLSVPHPAGHPLALEHA